MMTFPPSIAIIGSLLHRLYGFTSFQIGQATPAVYETVDRALQNAGFQWAPDFEGVHGCAMGQRIAAGTRDITPLSDPLVVLVLRFSHDRVIRSGSLREYLGQLIEDFCWSALERGLVTRDHTSWRLLPPPPTDTAASPQKANHENTTTNHRTRAKRDAQLPQPAAPKASTRARTSATKPVS